MNRMVRTAFVLAVFACASLLFVTKSSAQSVYGSIFGTVSDSTGAAIPGATITVKDETKGTVVTTTSNTSGDYSVPHLIPDVYDLKVTAKGFKAFVTTGISVLADTAPRIDPTLQVGAADTTVTVNADQEPMLKTASADVSTVLDQQQVSSLPVGDQNFTNLQLLVPGAQLLGWSHAADENPQGSKQIQVDGQAFGGTAFELDGTDNQDPILGIIVINPTMDAVTETKITTQNFDAEFGKAVSAVVTAQTRSGTNSFHGDAYDFRTGNANVARDPYSQPVNSVPPGLKNRMGASIGGPIKKDKAFFFFNYEGQRQKVGTSATDTLPTTNLTESALGNIVGPGFDGNNTVAGADFGEYEKQFGAAGIIYDTTKPYLGTDGKTHYQPFPDNVIPAADLSPQTLALLGILEPFTKGITPNSTGAQGNLDQNFHESGTGLFNSNQWTERVDFTLNQKAHVFERFSRFWDTLSGTVMFGSAGGPGFGINNYGGNSNGANDSLASGMDIAINPTLLTDFRLGYYRYNVIDSKHDQGVEFANQLGIPGINIGGTITSGSPGFNVTNVPGGSGGTNGTVYGDGLNVDRCNCPLIEREDQFQIVNNWTKIVGNHTFKVGVDLRYGRNLRVPSDNDRAGLLNFNVGPTEDPAAGTPGGLGFATFMLGDVTSFNRYVSTSTNAKEFQKRTFFFAQDTWRATHNLTLNLGIRWEIYFPETVNGPGNGSLLNLNDGYMHVAGIGGIGSNLGWSINKWKQFAPRLGVTYQFDPKTVVRAGYGRSFDTGVFGSIFGHTVTQNIPVLANQQLNSQTNIGEAFTLAVGPTPYVPLTTPPNGLLPNPGTQVSSSARNNPLTFPTIDAWNLSVERALTPTMTLTVAYVGNKGTHTLGDGDSNGTNPNEQAVFLPGANSVTGQALHYDNSVPTNTISANGGANGNLLERYYAATLPACHDPNYVTPNEPYVTSGMCGWNNSIAYRGDDQNTEYDALQVTFAKQFTHGLSYNANYQWASAFDEQSGYYTWSHSITHGRDTNVRDQQINLFGTYQLPFGKGRQFASNANRATDLIIGGYQISEVTTWAGGLPFTLGYNECSSNVVTGPCDPSENHKMSTSLTAFVPSANGTGNRTFYPAHTLGDGTFVDPGLDNFGNAGINTYRGPRFFSTDLNLIKTFNIWENVATVFRMDAFNAFNHITAGNPGGNIESIGSIGSEGGGCGPGNDCGPRQLEFSLRVQF
ncbi:MAG TPA: carboxypeptidase regulatory-like domain-containing protein [Terracidiphilus sp.]|nr:carboxypeptidase regulatory-like domain-containing protein [Terracidiphilus sp.]